MQGERGLEYMRGYILMSPESCKLPALVIVLAPLHYPLLWPVPDFASLREIHVGILQRCF